ncbi:MAG: tetratricopeptide repeat protein [Pseudomonadota bacterium]|uniref:Tetratricopeptide repeat protein n=1 Tax=Candidatus Desulfatibia profunda TaxID=2841695 RepID=A0A8J6NS22_9BACT|nr:tetratricopeptide repeat protein [Candidatus Desulfatibia profunda]MBL7180260.1 tetratricopeptide repeat protein [Desulfobacterales bacterium]
MTSPEYNEYRALLKKGRHIEAANLAEMEYLQGNRNNPFWLTRQAAALSRAGRYEQAYSVAEQALALQPANPYGLLAKAEALSGLGRIEEALSYYQEIIDDAKLSLVAQKGMLYGLSELKQWERILQLLAQWQMPPATCWPYKVKALIGFHRLDEAMEACYRWLELQPDNRQGLWALTELEIQRDGLEAVITKMGRLAKIDSRPPIYKEIYASLCRRAGRPELALKQYEKLTQSGADPRILRQQAFALKKAGKDSEVIPMLEELLRLNPEDYFLHSSYISACKQSRQLDRALKFYENLIELHPQEKPLYGRIKAVQKLLGVEK